MCEISFPLLGNLVINLLEAVTLQEDAYSPPISGSLLLFTFKPLIGVRAQHVFREKTQRVSYEEIAYTKEIARFH